MIRKLIVDTDGETIGVSMCELNALELKTVLDLLGEALRQGRFPFPKPKPTETNGQQMIPDAD